jgi:hypothetical protein
MTLSSSGHHARAVTFGFMTKGKGVSSRASLIISTKIPVGNTVSFGHQAKAVSSGQTLKKKRKKSNKKIKAIKGLEKMHP